MKNKRGIKSLALSEIAIVILSTIAVAYMIGLSLPVVSATGDCVTIQIGSRGSETCEPPSVWRGSEDVYCREVRTEYEGSGADCVSHQCARGAGQVYPRCSLSVRASPPNPVNTESQASARPNPTPVVNAAEKVAGAVQDNQDNTRLTNDVKEAAESAKAGASAAALRTAGKIIKTGVVAVVIYFALSKGLQELGADREAANAAGLGGAAGYVGYKLLTAVGVGGATVFLAAGGIGVLVFLAAYRDVRYDQYTFSCYPWQAPSGGSDCQKCNTGELPCTEYRCKSLGARCVLENSGSEEANCVWNNTQDRIPPQIRPWRDILTAGYVYSDDNAVNPPDRGVKIVPTDDSSGCIEPYKKLELGVMLDEPGRCRVDTVNERNFADMDYLFGGALATYNKSISLSHPSISALEAEGITLENGGVYSLFLKCQDTQENENLGNFVFKFCIDEGPDESAPVIERTSLVNGAYVSFDTPSVNLIVEVNEPAECKWSMTDQGYSTMENQMTCKTGSLQQNRFGRYECSTTLTGLKNEVNNDYYFRCKNQPHLKGTVDENLRRENSESYKFTLKGTRAIYIDSVGPNGTIRDSADVVKVTLTAKTSAGADQGKATCEYSGYGTSGYNQFISPKGYSHSQDLYLPEGEYTYDIRCTDDGGNRDNETTSFTVETDREVPLVVRAFNEGNQLKIITNEEASCFYSTSTEIGCGYATEEGTEMVSTDDKKHQIAWDPTKTFYIKCQDEYKNQPAPNQCSITVRPFV